MNKFESIQQACDYAIKKIAEQGCRSATPFDCYYNHPKKPGVHCVIGHLLTPEEQAFIDMFSGGVEPLTVFIEKSLKLKGGETPFTTEDVKWLRKHATVLGMLQSFHDTQGSGSRRSYRKKLEEFGIDTSAPQWDEWMSIEVSELEEI